MVVGHRCIDRSRVAEQKAEQILCVDGLVDQNAAAFGF